VPLEPLPLPLPTNNQLLMSVTSVESVKT
jgi:hypothetical protein